MFLTDPRRHHRSRSHQRIRHDHRDDVVASLIDVRGEETTALLAVFAEFAGDNELLVARIRRELANRPAVEPIWLANLSETQTYRAVRMVHVLDDGDNIMLGVRLPGGHELTCLVYVDHNVGTLVKDALVIPDSIERAEAKQRELTDDPDTRWDVLSLADARVWVDDAIKRGAITFPPFETEDWPACRALVEWVIRGLPAGGVLSTPEANTAPRTLRRSPRGSSPRRTDRRWTTPITARCSTLCSGMEPTTAPASRSSGARCASRSCSTTGCRARSSLPLNISQRHRTCCARSSGSLTPRSEFGRS